MLPGAQANVILLSVASDTYTFGVMQVTVESQAIPKITLLRLLVIVLRLLEKLERLSGLGFWLSE